MMAELKDRCLTLTVGLPRAGKSTWCRDQAIDTPIVCPDEIRRQLGCFPFVARMEPLVWWVARVMVETLFASGAPVVILDACNITKARRAEWVSPKWATVARVFRTEATKCKQRALVDSSDHLLPVIDRMVTNYEEPTEEEGLIIHEHEERA